MYTEEAATTKSCPLTRKECWGSECMAWRWDTEHNDAALDEGREAWREEPDTERYADSKYKPLPRGYCGMAGKP
jgi:hypothetical protein